MKTLPPVVLALSLLASVAALPPAIAGPEGTADSIRYTVRVTDLNRVGLTVTNYGVIGNNFVSRSPSLEYPLGTGYEHLTTGGFWFGAHAVDDAGAFTGVSTSAQDGNIGGSTQQITEFTPAGLDIGLRSRIPSNPHFDPAAVSDMDYLWTFSDRPARTTSWPESHRPLNILVRGSVFSWNSTGLRDFLILRFVVINLGVAPLNDAWAGLWTEFASGDKNSYSCWPPSSACGSTGSWFSKKWLQHEPGFRMVREHYCAALPVPGGCILDRAPVWMGVQVLSHPAPWQHVTLAAWNYAPRSELRDQDTERYAIMSAGTTQDLTQPDLMPQTGDPVELLALGPFTSIAAGDSITVDFALVGGAEVADIKIHADSAQVLYDRLMNFEALTGVDHPPVAGFVLSGVRPNPSPGGLVAAFSLPDAAPARIEVVDVAGRRVLAREVGALGAGSHVVDLTRGERLPAGIYLIRLTRGGRALTARAVVIR